MGILLRNLSNLLISSVSQSFSVARILQKGRLESRISPPPSNITIKISTIIKHQVTKFNLNPHSHNLSLKYQIYLTFPPKFIHYSYSFACMLPKLNSGFLIALLSLPSSEKYHMQARNKQSNAAPYPCYAVIISSFSPAPHIPIFTPWSPLTSSSSKTHPSQTPPHTVYHPTALPDHPTTLSSPSPSTSLPHQPYLLPYPSHHLSHSM